MLRQIIMPENKTVTLQLPDELVGKTVEIIAFEIDTQYPATKDININSAVAHLKGLLKNYTTNSGGYKFNRDEANDYE